MPTTLLPANPFLDSFSSGTVDPPWAVLPSPMTAGCTVAGTGGLLTFTIASGTNASFTDIAGVAPAPRAVLHAFTDDTWDGDSANDFLITFKVSALTIVNAAGKAAGGIGLFRAGATNEFLPLIEFGGNDNANKRAYYSWGGAKTIGATKDVAIPVALPLYVRVVRSDAVIYAEYATSPNGPWNNLSTTAALGSLARVDASGGTKIDFSQLVVYARNESSGSGITFSIDNFAVSCWPRFALPVQVTSLTAKTWPAGRQINLAWQNPPATSPDAIQYMSLMRSKYGHPEFKRPVLLVNPPDGLGLGALGEELYSGVPISSFVDQTVTDDSFYYYSLFTSRAPKPASFSGDAGTLNEFANYPTDTDWGPQAAPTNKVTGYAMHDYFGTDGDYFYKLFPLTYREADQQDASDLNQTSGLLERFAKFLQGGIDSARGQINGLNLVRDPEKAPLGLVGTAADQTSIVDTFLRDRNVNPSTPGLDAISKRRLWLGLIGAYKTKPSRSGACAFAKLLTGWTAAVCSEPGLDTSLRFLRTWDGATTKEDFTILKSSLTFAAGSITIAGGTLTPHKYAGGKYVDFFGNVKTITDNTATVITLADSSFTGYAEIVAAVTVSGGTTATVTGGWPMTGGPNDNAYDGAKAIAQSNFGTLLTILATSHSALSFTLSSAITNGATNLAIAFTEAAGGSFAARVATHKFSLLVGEPSWLYNPKSDLTLRGTLNDPYYVTWPGTNYYGSGLGVTAGDRDFMITAPVGAARYPTLTIISTTSVTDEIWVDATSLSDPIRPGDYINPNRNQGQWFRVIQVIITGGQAHIRIVPEFGLTPADLATAGDIAVIAPRATVERDRQLRALIPLVLPHGSRLLVYYS